MPLFQNYFLVEQYSEHLKRVVDDLFFRRCFKELMFLKFKWLNNSFESDDDIFDAIFSGGVQDCEFQKFMMCDEESMSNFISAIELE